MVALPSGLDHRKPHHILKVTWTPGDPGLWDLPEAPPGLLEAPETLLGAPGSLSEAWSSEVEIDPRGTPGA